MLDPAGMDGAITDTATGAEQAPPPGHRLLWGLPAATASGYDPAGVAYGYLGGSLRDLGAFGVARMVAGGGPQPAAAEPLYPALVAVCSAGAVGGLTALAIALRGRRRAAARAPRTRRRRTAAGAAWAVVTILPATATALLVSEMGLRGSFVWPPDATAGAVAATVLGTAAGLIGFARSLRG
ncbi:hypothetical protein ACFO4E_26260 [Nocardiopsis mangrovi]|uniref:Uncharacterized protein n=1 Tax=Nocardiopsis mangrovi TaxID=1179818 RepID=A0ABV9E2H2_9ACTN